MNGQLYTPVVCEADGCIYLMDARTRQESNEENCKNRKLAKELDHRLWDQGIREEL